MRGSWRERQQLQGMKKSREREGGKASFPLHVLSFLLDAFLPLALLSTVTVYVCMRAAGFFPFFFFLFRGGKNRSFHSRRDLMERAFFLRHGGKGEVALSLLLCSILYSTWLEYLRKRKMELLIIISS